MTEQDQPLTDDELVTDGPTALAAPPLDPDATGPIGALPSIRMTAEMPRIPLPGIPEEAARLQFERRATRWLPIDAQVVADQQRTADFYLKVGLVKQKLDVSKTFDSQFAGVA